MIYSKTEKSNFKPFWQFLPGFRSSSRSIKPFLQTHLYESTVSIHIAFLWHVFSDGFSHSFTICLQTTPPKLQFQSFLMNVCIKKKNALTRFAFKNYSLCEKINNFKGIRETNNNILLVFTYSHFSKKKKFCRTSHFVSKFSHNDYTQNPPRNDP